MLCVMVLVQNGIVLGQHSLGDCECDTTLKHLTNADLDLLVEYALLGEDYDSVVYQLKEIQKNIEEQLSLCDMQQEFLEEIIVEIKDYVTLLEEENAKKFRRVKILKTISYLSVGANAVLVLILITK